MPLLDGGITTLRSGLRPPIPMFPPGGGGDLVGMTLPRPFPLGVARSPGDPRGLMKPFPADTRGHSRLSGEHAVISQTSNAPFENCLERYGKQRQVFLTLWALLIDWDNYPAHLQK